MARPAETPKRFAHLTELSLDVTGSLVLHASDEFFAPADGLLRPASPEWREGEYTDRGKWMDGWESRRRPAAGSDFAIVRLGTPGVIEGVICDTTHFKGNAPLEVSLDALQLSPTTAVADLLGLPDARDPAELEALAGRAWLCVLPRTRVEPDRVNELLPSLELPRATHVRFRIHPDGGVARLRIFGRVRPDAALFRGPGSVDLAAIDNGGTIVSASDAFFGPAGNLLLPGRGVDMGDGWETKRRRTPGTDWCVVRLGRRGIVQRLELDTHRFKGNAPAAVRVESLDAGTSTEPAAADLSPDSRGWSVLLDTTALAPHMNHVFDPPFVRIATHLRVHILPHGGVNRLRVLGQALDTAGEARSLAVLNAMAGTGRESLLRSFCGCDRFVSLMAAALPVPSVRDLFASADRALAALGEADWLEAFASHPRLGESRAKAPGSAPEWSRAEQSGLAGAGAKAMERLRTANLAYEERFGFVFLAFASGRGPGELLELLEERLAGERDTELATASREQARITRHRIGSWIDSPAAS